ncbi:MAG TPA: YraN family protein [Thermohalobaculum sp.]|nr:YraN family protein [Thermohalobaculum sp.]
MSARRGRGAYFGGLSAEEQAARAYRRRGAEILARRHRNAAGEIDLILREGDILVFVEVKQRRHDVAHSISERQWRRLGLAATQYMLANSDKTGDIRGCRFDAVLIGGDGGLEIVENARTFDEY